MGTLNEDLTSIKTVEDTLTSNKVANFAYTDKAYEKNYANGVVEYDVSKDQNIPVSTPSVLKVNETILAKGWRAKASSITRMLMNHFLGRLSYNLNKVNDNMSSLLSTLQSHLGTANGLATLDSTGRIPYSQLPESAIEYKGQWDASTNTPTLADGTGTSGDFYIVSVAGTQDLGSGDIQFFENDRVIYDGSVWDRLSAGDVKTVNNVSPVNGNITLTKSDVGLGNVVNTGDSATPASGGTEKFTTGGAYTELNKKQDKITADTSTSDPTDSDVVGAFGITQSPENPTSFTRWTFAKVWNWIKVKLGVRSGTTDTAVGSSTKPVYLNSSGKAVAVDNNSALVNLSSTSSANMYDSAPRPGVTGVLPIANGGTGKNNFSETDLIKGSNASGICTTGIDASTKEVSISGFSLYTGVTVRVMFRNGNRVANPTLNVNNTGAKAIRVVQSGVKKALSNAFTSTSVNALKTGYWRGASSTSDEMWQEYTILDLMYDGDTWVIIGNPVVESYYNTKREYGYKVYADGSVELWGVNTSDKSTPITLKVQFNSSSSYIVTLTPVDGSTTVPNIVTRTPSSFTVQYSYSSTTTYSRVGLWYATGY